jgi:hypothetical protein
MHPVLGWNESWDDYIKFANEKHISKPRQMIDSVRTQKYKKKKKKDVRKAVRNKTKRRTKNEMAG